MSTDVVEGLKKEIVELNEEITHLRGNMEAMRQAYQRMKERWGVDKPILPS